MKTKTKIIGALAVIIAIVIIALFSRGCNKPPVDPSKKVIDSLISVIEDKNIEIEKQDQIIQYYAQAYDSTANVNDSLASRGVKTITKYREVKVQGDNTEIIAVCDSLVTEYREFILQTKQTLEAADSVLGAQSVQTQTMKDQLSTFDQLTGKLKDKIAEQQREIDKWRKLAKRRGRTIEW